MIIPIKNIYYMLSYAFEALKFDGYKKLETESFENFADLSAAILVNGISIEIRRGLRSDYLRQSNELSGIKGKIELTKSIKKGSLATRKLICSYDVFFIDCYLNQIIKTTLSYLLTKKIKPERKRDIRKVLGYFESVKSLELKSINWKIQFNKNNKNYLLLINLCYMIAHELLQGEMPGEKSLNSINNQERMSRLYEKFILKYYEIEHPELSVAASKIEWFLDDDYNEMLPSMNSDITISSGNKVLIIDAKYYNHSVQTHYDKQTIHSHNLYQIFTYVKNKDAEIRKCGGTVSGLLLYAGTDDVKKPNNTYMMSGNKISVKSLELDKEFKDIKIQLEQILVENNLR